VSFEYSFVGVSLSMCLRFQLFVWRIIIVKDVEIEMKLTSTLFCVRLEVGKLFSARHCSWLCLLYLRNLELCFWQFLTQSLVEHSLFCLV